MAGRPKNRIPTVTVSIQLTRAVRRRIGKLAAAEGLAVATWVRRVILKAIADADASDTQAAA